MAVLRSNNTTGTPSPWDMPGHTAGETTAIWAILAILPAMLILGIVVDFMRKRNAGKVQGGGKATWAGKLSQCLKRKPKNGDPEKGLASDVAVGSNDEHQLGAHAAPPTAPPSSSDNPSVPAESARAKCPDIVISAPGPSKGLPSMLGPDPYQDARRTSFSSNSSRHSIERPLTPSPFARPLAGRLTDRF